MSTDLKGITFHEPAKCKYRYVWQIITLEGLQLNTYLDAQFFWSKNEYVIISDFVGTKPYPGAYRLDAGVKHFAL